MAIDEHIKLWGDKPPLPKEIIDSGIIQEIKGYFLGGYWVNKRFIELDISEKRDEKLKKLGI